MHTKLALCALTMYLAAGTMAAASARRSWFEAYTGGAKELTLRGEAEFGPVPGDRQPGSFVLTLGAESSTGAVVFTSRSASRPEPGTYLVGRDGVEGMTALVVTGSPTHPTGAYHARTGTLTITRSDANTIEGRFDLATAGFEAADPAVEDRQLVVRGAFTAAPSAKD